MTKKRRWFDRTFSFDLDPENFPLIVERLRGTPARLEDRISHLSKEQLTRRVQDAWSIQENVGHLADLEPLWSGRLDDLLAGTPKLRPADLSNAATEHANHNAKPMDEILQRFRRLRTGFVSQLDRLDDKDILATAIHPRLKKPMRTIDLVYFVAEHDDHHLATITELLAS